MAQKVLLFEDFESATPDPPLPDECATGMSGGMPLNAAGRANACFGGTSVDTFNRSRVLDELESLATITGATFPDPFGPENQSVVFHNPYSSTQEAVNWFSIFPDDVNNPNYYLRNGIIEFDAYLEAPLPTAKWSFLEIRFGFEPDPALRNQVSTVNNSTLRNSFRMAEGGLEGETGAVDRFFDQLNETTYFDTDDLVVTDVPIHVRYDIDGNNSQYRVTMDNLADDRDPVELVWSNGQVDQPFGEYFDFTTFEFKPAPGINVITFITDASGLSWGPTTNPNVYIDNLRIVDNDQLPSLDSADFDGDNDVDGRDFLIWQRGFGINGGASHEQGDANGDGKIDAEDLVVWQQQYGNSGLVGTLNSVTQIPEPGTQALLFLASTAITSHMMRRRSVCNPR